MLSVSVPSSSSQDPPSVHDITCKTKTTPTSEIDAEAHAANVAFVRSIVLDSDDSISENHTDAHSTNVEDDVEYPFESILGKKTIRGKIHYLVNYEGSEAPSWQPAKNVPMKYRKGVKLYRKK